MMNDVNISLAPVPAVRIREGFSNQRLIRLSDSVLQRCKELPLISSLYVTSFGEYPSAPHHYVERKEGLPQVSMHYCLKGHGFIEMDNSVFFIEPGCMMFIPSGVPHIYGAQPDHEWAVLWVNFDGSQKTSVLKSLGVDQRNPILYAPDISMIEDAFEDLYACVGYNYSDAGLLAMSGELMRFLSKVKLNSSFSQKKDLKVVESRVMQTIDFMEKHLDVTISLQSLAARAGQSASHYGKLFKHCTSLSPIVFFNQLKIRKACELLRHTDLSVGEISERLGITDVYYFSRLFKKIQGCSPRFYRESVSR